MKWRKLGRVYTPSTDVWWAKGAYAHLPTADIINNEFIRVYFATLDENRYGRISYVDLDMDDPTRILDQSRQPVLDIGEPGTFDDSGVNPSCLLTINNQKYFYYIGWQRCERVPYMLYSGLAISDDGTNFYKPYRSPILDRTTDEPYLRSATTIIRDEDLYRCWYVSARDWTVVNGTQYPSYVIRHALSTDGIKWQADIHVCIDLADEEFGIGRPWVIKDKDCYRMWYSIRSRTEPYHLGYAESADGLRWERMDNLVSLVRSDSGWDSEMICYPCVLDVKGNRYMFYNGNRHGESGFGCAIYEG